MLRGRQSWEALEELLLRAGGGGEAPVKVVLGRPRGLPHAEGGVLAKLSRLALEEELESQQ